MALNLVAETLEKHSDDEIIAYLDSVMKGILKNYKIAVGNSEPAVLFGCLGDLVQVSAFLSAMKKRDELRKVQQS